jgi:light-harvesting complex 1 beta chain
MENKNGGMGEEEARMFHGYFVVGTAVYVGTAIVAHLLAWSWRPWF